MTALKKLQKRLEELPETEREAMAVHLLSEWEAQQWDKQIAADAEAGRLDHLTEQAKEDHRASRTYSLSGFEPVPYERIAHLAGVLKGGPHDLASNKRYLEGLGERSMR